MLDRLSDPPRSYADKIKMEDDVQMQNGDGQNKTSNGHLTLAERFGKIQDAKRAIPFMAMKNKQTVS